ncbi:hypothetical protein HJC23_013357 [Cyclotella cryptica]|uniref:Uncharacterized protein n=1 Tax=Cyclotella cryptica TaxID=29204 RepID=A0ABD3P8Q2_9STRA|eukprot:CCRYP_016857-RA/>CCRYP_016857-RA protein AED:0.08 eAED:0.09 QI:0/-1/0/1/-1/1/1/0/688
MEEQDAPVHSNDTAPAAATSNSSLASSLKTPASAPAIGRTGSTRNLVAIPSGQSLGDFRSYDEDGSSYEGGGASKLQFQDSETSRHSSRYSQRSGPQRRRQKTMRELQEEVRRRSQLRSDPSSRYFARGDDKHETKKTEGTAQDKKGVSKTLTDLLFQTAVLGIDATAKLTRPTLPLLTQVILPLFRDLWEQYAPLRLQTWMKVLPSYLSNVGSLIWDTESGKSLCDKLNQLTDDVIDMASSDVARQCWVDFTVTVIKIIESLHTPEVKALLEQSAVGMCRFVDVFNSGKAKQVWFDISATLWAMVEVGSDPLVVMTLAEGCAQICFALEEERISLKRRRLTENAARRRKERDQRQMDVYPPDKDVVSGREGVEKALVCTLGNDHVQEQTEKDAPVHDGPPSVILRNNLLNVDRPGLLENNTLGRIDSTGHDDESEITTEIEDLQFKEETNNDNWINLESRGKPLAYEQGDDDSCPDFASEHNQHPENNAAEADTYDVFHESILQFHRRLNEVLAETRNKSKLREAIEKKVSVKENKADKKIPVLAINRANDAARENVVARRSDLIHTLATKRWKIFLIVSICTIATIIMSWFALGCYGFYVLFLGGGKAPHLNSRSTTLSPPFDAYMQQPPSIIIQVVVGQSKAPDNDRNIGSNSERLASMTLEEWKQMALDVDAAIRQQMENDNEL